MIEGLLTLAVISLFDPGLWLLVTLRLLERADSQNRDLRNWELTGL